MQEMKERLEAIFRMGGVPFKSVDAFGSQVIVTCWSRDAAEKCARLLQRGSFVVRGVAESIDYNQDQTHRRTNAPASHKVWLVGAYV